MIRVPVVLAKSINNAMEKPSYYMGLMAGTSLDGVDTVLVDKDCKRLIAQDYLPYSAGLKQQLVDIVQNPTIDKEKLAKIDTEVAKCFASAANQLLEKTATKKSKVKAIGSHGQSIFHQGGDYSWQIGHGAIIADRTGLKVINDFRMADIAAGGQGAPLTPLYHQYLLAGDSAVVINLGGIANLTRVSSKGVIGFDTGPANTLLDQWMRKTKDLDYDRDGIFSRSGQLIEPLLNNLLDDAYFSKSVPKSTGPEYFNLHWLQPHLNKHKDKDVMRTLVELTAVSITQNLQEDEKIYLCGGGTHNLFLVERLSYLNPSCEFSTTDELGMPIDFVEAAAFAFFAKQTLASTASNLPSVTGATKNKVLGAIHHA